RDPGIPRGRLHPRHARALGGRQDRPARPFQQRGPAAREVSDRLSVGIVGAGIQVSPNASRILHRLRLADALARMGVRPLAWRQRRWDDGRTLLHTPLADAVVEAFGFPHYQTHRADLLEALVRELPT